VKMGYACALSKCISRAFYHLLRPLLLTVREKKNTFDLFLHVFYSDR